MNFDLNDLSVDEFRVLWDNNGYFGPKQEDRVQVEDALATPNASFFFPQTISNIVREAIEPLLVGTSLLTRINYQYGQHITFPAVGALVANDIPESGEYPEQTLQVGGATVTATIGKSGLAVKVTEEMIRYSQFDVIGMHLRAAGRALARHKEVKIFNMIRALGVPAFDNLRPNKAVFGVTTGRNQQGGPNGSVTMDDIFDAFAQVISQGFMPNTLLMHPLTWTMFVKDPQLRAFVQANGGGVYFASWTGNPAGRAPWDAATQGGLGPSTGQQVLPGQTTTGGTAPHGQAASQLLQYPQTLNSAPILPNYMNVPFRIIVSPWVPYDPDRRLTDIYMFDSSELGVLVVDHDVMTEEWKDPRNDMTKVKLKERYALGMLNEGNAVATLRNVHVVPNQIVLPAQTTIDISSKIQDIDPSIALSL
jgi:hypothetical protein